MVARRPSPVKTSGVIPITFPAGKGGNPLAGSAGWARGALASRGGYPSARRPLSSRMIATGVGSTPWRRAR